MVSVRGIFYFKCYGQQAASSKCMLIMFCSSYLIFLMSIVMFLHPKRQTEHNQAESTQRRAQTAQRVTRVQSPCTQMLPQICIHWRIKTKRINKSNITCTFFGILNVMWIWTFLTYRITMIATFAIIQKN